MWNRDAHHSVLNARLSICDRRCWCRNCGRTADGAQQCPQQQHHCGSVSSRWETKGTEDRPSLHLKGLVGRDMECLPSSMGNVQTWTTLTPGENVQQLFQCLWGGPWKLYPQKLSRGIFWHRGFYLSRETLIQLKNFPEVGAATVEQKSPCLWLPNKNTPIWTSKEATFQMYSGKQL